MGETSRMSIQSVTVKVNPKTTKVFELLNAVSRKYRISDPDNYGLVVFDGFMSQSGLWLDDNKMVSNYKLKGNVSEKSLRKN